MSEDPLIRVMALHALAYCERLFYLEEVEEIRVADHRVHAGRTLHEAEVDKNREWQSLELASDAWGIRGKVDYARYRDGRLVAIEHKKGRSRGDDAWDTDKLQVIAYAVLLSEHFERPVPEGRIRYHANNKTVRVDVDAAARERLRRAVARARELSLFLERPPVTDNENLCAKCSLAPVCLPEESRLAAALDEAGDVVSVSKPRRLFPKDDARRVLHVVDRDAQVRRAGLQLVVRNSNGQGEEIPRYGCPRRHPARQRADHFAGHSLRRRQRHCRPLDQWRGLVRRRRRSAPWCTHRRLRQYRALQDQDFCLRLARRLAEAKMENQLRFVTRQSRTRKVHGEAEVFLNAIRNQLREVRRCADADALRGCEGIAARNYFSVLALLLDPEEKLMAFSGRSRRPPRDGFNAALSFGYGLLYREVMAAIIAVGLDSTIGFFHAPRTAAHPAGVGFNGTVSHHPVGYAAGGVRQPSTMDRRTPCGE